MLGFHCRLVWRIEWLTLLPTIGFLPHISHLAMLTSFSKLLMSLLNNRIHKYS
jgi:hypothetical protein